MIDIYLAVPYTHPKPEVRALRFERVTTLAGQLIKQGHKVYSPISSNHPVAERVDLPHDWKFWLEFDLTFLDLCKELHVYMLDGWETSPGVSAEIEHATKSGKPIIYIDKEY